MLASDFNSNGISFLNVDCEAVSDVAQELNVSYVPTVLFMRCGTEISRVSGVKIPELAKTLTGLQSTYGFTSHNGNAPKKDDLSCRLHDLINRAPVMLFMKGNPEEPKCGFSRKIVEILLSVNAKFDTFDILQDETVRQGLKSYSNWPTYPQLYIKGQLVGGLDIVKEMADSGELASVVKI